MSKKQCKTKKAIELEKILLQDNINEGDLLRVLPELKILKGCSQKHPAHCYDVLKHTIKVVEGVPKEVLIRITALLHDIGKPNRKVLGDDGVEHFWGHEEEGAKIAKSILEKLGYEDNFINNVVNIIKMHDTSISLSKEGIQEMINTIGENNFRQLIIHQKADLRAHSKEYYDRKINILNKINDIYDDMQKIQEKDFSI